MSLRTSLLTLLSTIELAFSSSCQDAVFSIPIHDVQVDPNIPNSFVIGAATRVGTPQQNLVVFPWAELNNTYLYDQNAFCDPTVIYGDTLCHVRRGGFFQETNSSSWQQQVDVVSAGGSSQETTNPAAELGIKDLIATSLGGDDTFQLDSQNALVNFPLGIPREKWDYGYSILHPLGMGPNSTYLNALYTAGTIKSKVWSFFYGRWWNSDPVNGSMVIGGYDERLVVGKNYTAPLDYSGDCFTGLKMNVLDITLNFRNGSNAKLLSSETPACIIPTRPNLLGLLESYLVAFENLTNVTSIGPSYGMHWNSMLLDASIPYYDGDMTIDLSTGMSVRIPNDQIITPHVDYDRNGSRVFNESERDVLITGLAQNTVTLGRYFLTSAYLMVDYDNNQFTMWSANPTTLSSLKPVINDASSELCSTTASGGATSTASPLGNARKGMSTAALAGVVISCIAVAAAILVGCTLIWQRKMFRRRASPPTLPPKEQPGLPYELSNASNPSSVRWTQSFWPSKKIAGRAELHETYLQLSPAGRHELKAARSSISQASNRVYYEMPDPRQLPSSPLMHEEGALA